MKTRQPGKIEIGKLPKSGMWMPFGEPPLFLGHPFIR